MERRNSGERIVKVRAMERKADGLSPPEEYERIRVVESIAQGNNWYTCEKAEENKWERKAEIHVIEIDGEKFIRTDRNDIKSDNLGELPDF